jgi:hypothetical protein
MASSSGQAQPSERSMLTCSALRARPSAGVCDETGDNAAGASAPVSGSPAAAKAPTASTPAAATVPPAVMANTRTAARGVAGWPEAGRGSAASCEVRASSRAVRSSLAGGMGASRSRSRYWRSRRTAEAHSWHVERWPEVRWCLPPRGNGDLMCRSEDARDARHGKLAARLLRTWIPVGQLFPKHGPSAVDARADGAELNAQGPCHLVV